MRYRGTRRDDSLIGGDADDLFLPLLGHDTVDGGGGRDTLQVDYSALTRSAGATNIFVAADGSIAGTIAGDANNSVEFTAIERILFTATRADDFVFLEPDALLAPDVVVLDGGAGSDQLAFYAFDEDSASVFVVNPDLTVSSSDGTFRNFEYFQLYMGGGDDVVKTRGGIDALFGMDGADRLAGGSGDDSIVGGRGDDRMAGGAGADRFRFETASEFGAGGDVITDFARADGDVIDLDAIDADRTSTGDQAFVFIGASTFTGAAGELRIASVKGDFVRLEGDNDRDGVADFALTVVTAQPLTSDAFML